MKILITGGTGFLGSHLARDLSGRGNEVLVLARQGSSSERLQGCEQDIHILRFETVVAAGKLLATHRPDCVIHTACNYGRAGENVADIVQANLVFALAVLNAAASSGSDSFINTDTTLDRFVNAYALSKKQFSEWGHLLAAQRRIQFINALLEHIYGPGDDASKFTTHVIRHCLQQSATLDLTPGEQQRDFIYIEDAVAAFRTLVENLARLPEYEDIPVGSGHAVTIREFTETAHSLAGSTTTLNFGGIPYRDREPMLSVADTTRLRALGWEPQHDLADGILKTLAAERNT